MLLKNEPTKERELPPEGTHAARCFMIADLGSQTTLYMGAEKTQRKIVIGWELPGALMEDGRPFVITEKFTASLYEKAKLRQVLKSWRGKDFTPEEEAGFDPVTFLAQPCFLGVVHGTSDKTGKTYANITSVLNVPPGIQVPSLVNGPYYFSLDDYNQSAFDALPEWVRKAIMESPEYKAVQEGTPVGESYGARISENTTPTKTHGGGVQSGATEFDVDALLTEDDIPF